MNKLPFIEKSEIGIDEQVKIKPLESDSSLICVAFTSNTNGSGEIGNMPAETIFDIYDIRSIQEYRSGSITFEFKLSHNGKCTSWMSRDRIIYPISE